MVLKLPNWILYDCAPPLDIYSVTFCRLSGKYACFFSVAKVLKLSFMWFACFWWAYERQSCLRNGTINNNLVTVFELVSGQQTYYVAFRKPRSNQCFIFLYCFNLAAVVQHVSWNRLQPSRWLSHWTGKMEWVISLCGWLDTFLD